MRHSIIERYTSALGQQRSSDEVCVTSAITSKAAEKRTFRHFAFVGIAVVVSPPIHLLNNPIISAFASVLKCKLKPTTAADVSAFTSSLSVFTAKTANK